MYVEDSSGNSNANLENAGTVTATALSHSPAAGRAPTDMPVFIKSLLHESNDSEQTSLLLIDFNRAELRNEKQHSRHKRMDRTGTHIFIARAVETGKAVPLPSIAAVPDVPKSPQIYASIHRKRINKFQSAGWLILEKPQRDASPWRHDLDHDAESVFWLLLYWAMVVQPANSDDPPEVIDPSAWVSLLGEALSRNQLVGSIVQYGFRSGLIHSIYKPLYPLIKSLASILIVDRQWLTESDVRNDPAYITEAFQRLILSFIIEHRQEGFMDSETGIEFRSVKQTPNSNALSATHSERLSTKYREGLSDACSATMPILSATTVERKRAPPSPMDDVKWKRQRLALAPVEGAGDEPVVTEPNRVR